MVCDMWGDELHIGDIVHGIVRMATDDLGAPYVGVYKITEIDKDGKVHVSNAHNRAGRSDGYFSKPYESLSLKNLKAYNPKDLGYEKLFFDVWA